MVRDLCSRVERDAVCVLPFSLADGHRPFHGSKAGGETDDEPVGHSGAEGDGDDAAPLGTVDGRD